ncbi:MAG: glycogen/starch synthase [Candidatus Beckwithbacteria bacterium]
MKILLVAAEVAPYSKVGGLSQVVYFLANSLNKQGHDVRIFTAKYGVIQLKKSFKKVVKNIKVPTGYKGKRYPTELICNIVTNQTKTPQVYFLENREYFELRSNVYDYSDDHIRFFLLSRGCLEWLRYQRREKGWLPQVIHVHDWHTSYLCEDLRENDRYKREFSRIPILLTVHNFHMQGKLNFQLLAKEQRDKGKGSLKHFFHKKLITQNPLLRGIIYADWVNTVSEAHSREVLTREYGEGLDEELNKYKGKLSGILNGLDTKEFNPLTDPLVKKNYSRRSIYLRKKNKADLQRKFDLNVSAETPLLAYSGRLAKQKGIELLFECIPRLVAEFDFQFIILGGGNASYTREIQKLKQKYPEKIAVHLYIDFKLPRKIFAGADMVLLPSIYEPCGIVAMEALRYGAIPVVRKTGGLGDIVTDFSSHDMKGNGFVFKKADPWSLYAVMVRGLEVYRFPKLWKKLIDNAMASNFSWDKAAKEYEKLYRRVLKLRREFVKDNPHLSRYPSLLK